MCKRQFSNFFHKKYAQTVYDVIHKFQREGANAAGCPTLPGANGSKAVGQNSERCSRQSVCPHTWSKLPPLPHQDTVSRGHSYMRSFDKSEVSKAASRQRFQQQNDDCRLSCSEHLLCYTRALCGSTKLRLSLCIQNTLVTHDGQYKRSLRGECRHG